MPRPPVIHDMAATLAERRFPSVTVWNRLEGRPRADNFERALRAEIRDPLWMLTRQWQLGEFEGDDAGSPVLAKVQMSAASLDGYQAGAHVPRALDAAIPLEATIEQRPLPFSVGTQPMSMDVRALMGRQWLKMLAKTIAVDLSEAYRDQYRIAIPDPDEEAHALVVAHPDGFQRVALMAGRAMDGYRFYRHVKDGHDAAFGSGAVGSDVTTIQILAVKFVAWFESLYLQPGSEDDGWQPSYLEYQFSLTASNAGRRYRADEYHQGRLDWYSIDRDASDDPLGDLQPAVPWLPAVHTFFPTQIVFEGMPNTRWWAFEDRKTNFGAIAPNTTELGKLLFVEFGLIYANDWFLLPQTLPVGTVAEVAGLMVTNAFGERFWIGAAGSREDEGWQRWSMFTNVRRGSHEIPADSGLLLVPGLPKVQEGPPIVDVTLIRDEIANMVWAIETRVPLPSGESAAGRESALQTVAFHRRILEKRFATSALQPLDRASAAAIRYEVMSTVPENWIPFIPVHVANDVRRIQLQRAALPRLLERDPRTPRKVEPRTPLMREGLDRVEKAPYIVYNEQVPRAGTRVYQAYQRIRWYGGRVITWLGARKQTGRGMGSSGLRFDSIRDVPPTAT